MFLMRVYWNIKLAYHLLRWNKYYKLLERTPGWPRDEPWPIEQKWIMMKSVHSCCIDYYEKKLAGKVMSDKTCKTCKWYVIDETIDTLQCVQEEISNYIYCDPIGETAFYPPEEFSCNLWNLEFHPEKNKCSE